MRLGRICSLLGLLWYSCWGKKTYKIPKGVKGRSDVSSSSSADSDPFEQMAQFLCRFGKGSDFERYSVGEIGRALQTLSKSQSALKSMDGATHQFRNVFKESSSLGGRYEKFMAVKSKKLKEAAKVYEYTRAVERGLQATEILQCAAIKQDKKRAEQFAQAGLRELKRSVVVVDKVRLVLSVLTPIQAPRVEQEKEQETGEQSDEGGIPHQMSKAARSEERRRRSQPQQFAPDELIIAISGESGDETSVAQLLRLITREKPCKLALKSPEAPTSEARGRKPRGQGGDGASASASSPSAGRHLSVQPALLSLARKVLQEAAEYLLPASAIEKVPASPITSTGSVAQLGDAEPTQKAKGKAGKTATSSSTGKSGATFSMRSNDKMDSVFIGGRASRQASLQSGASSPSNPSSSSSVPSISSKADEPHATIIDASKPTHRPDPEDATLSAAGLLLPQRVRIVGHSTGGAVAALAAIVLDGDFLRGGGREEEGRETEGAAAAPAGAVGAAGSPVPEDTVVAGSTRSDEQLAGMRSFIGRYCNRVTCVTLGAPPCVGRAVVPRYVTSLVCGDDVVPRAQAGALHALRSRVLKALQAGAGKGSLRYMLGAGMLSDLSSIAGKSLSHYKGTASKDEHQLSVPGRVFFVKPRKLKAGATIQRVLRGNWQEDMLWQLHDILLSKRMLEHHSLDSYIRTLNRC